MRFTFVTIITILFLFGCQKKSGTTNSKLDSLDKKVSYVFGQQIGREMKNQGVEVNVDILNESIREFMAGKEPRLKQDEMQKAMREMQTQMQAKQKTEAVENMKKGQEFLAKNKTQKGVQTTKSGLQFQVLKPGAGKKPKATEVVRVHYKGTLTDGKEFDSSYKRGQAAEFPLNRVIRGWTEGLQLMPIGSKFKFFVPSQLAYGPAARPSIPANSVLIFEVELLAIVDKNAPTPPAKAGKPTKKKGS